MVGAESIQGVLCSLEGNFRESSKRLLRKQLIQA